jgi:multiple antibiotic resistance protein
MPSLPNFDEFLRFSALALSSVILLVDPIATIPVFLLMTASATVDDRRRMARRAAWTCFAVLTSFCLAGRFLFRLFGITLPAFQIAGGLILLPIALDMLQARRSATKQVPAEVAEAVEKEDVGIIPLGMPMLAGPGAISTVTLLMAQAAEWWQIAAVLGSIAATSAVSYFALAGAERVGRRVSQTSIRVLTRIMGMLLTAIAVQFIVNGLTELGLFGPPGGTRKF